jgi:hypothetical protein
MPERSLYPWCISNRETAYNILQSAHGIAAGRRVPGVIRPAVNPLALAAQPAADPTPSRRAAGEGDEDIVWMCECRQAPIFTS